MTAAGSTPLPHSLAALAQDTPGLALLLVFGSQARGEAQAGSDWDLGYLGDVQVDTAELLAGLVRVLGTDRIDLVDLSRANGLVRFRAARDGRLVYEATEGAADAFRLEAARFWCDAAPVIERGYESVLADLRR